MGASKKIALEVSEQEALKGYWENIERIYSEKYAELKK